MANYKIFAEKDATLYSDDPNSNTGMDPILELSKQESSLFGEESTAARILIKFSDTNISDVITNYVSNNNYKAYLKIALADAQDIPADFTIIANPVFESWDMGTGRYLNVPATIDGVCWTYRNANNTNIWTTGSYPANVTASFQSGNPGGGSWYYNYSASQTFGVYVNKDIQLDVTSFIQAYVSGTINNNGFIIRNSGSIEFNENYLYKLAYFSRDTNTIYPPVLEFRWDDSVYNTTSSSISQVSNADIRVSIANNKAVYNSNEITRFRLNVRDQYPQRVFSTSSLYTVQKYLPTSSYYSVKDVKSDLTIIPFDTGSTKISADTNGNYFDIYMNGLEPERYYKILIKSVIGSETKIFDDQFFFKVVE